MHDDEYREDFAFRQAKEEFALLDRADCIFWTGVTALLLLAIGGLLYLAMH